MRIKTLLLFALAGFCSVGPAVAASRFVVLSAAHGFAIPHIARGAVLRGRPHFFGGAAATYDTLLSGTFPIAPDDSTGALPPLPYPPAVFYPADYMPQPHCVQPKIIYITDVKPAANLPRVIYGTPPQQCP